MEKNLNRKQILTTYILCGTAIFIFFFGLKPDWVLNYYSNGIYPIIAIVLRSISSIFPFAIGDLLYVALSILLLWQVFLFFKNIKSLLKTNKTKVQLKIFHISFIIYISFKLLWGLNYSRPSISQELKISDKKYNVKELVLLGNFFIDRVNVLQSKVNSNQAYTIETLREKAKLSYRELALKNSFFNYKSVSVKPVLNNWIVSKIGIEGYYNPLSGEANVNMKLLPWILPFVTCHEISHQLGVAREDEANLVAYLVGINSKDLNFQYSVNYAMLKYVLFEIRFKSPEDYIALRNKINPAVLANFKSENEFWRKYNGRMSNYMGAAFDKFLKMNNQKRGIKSYQNIVIWLWNYHQKEILG